MTNSSDFRRYAYSADASYALEAFNAHRTAAAPAYQPPRRQRKRELRVHENTRLKSEQQLHAEGHMAAKQAAILVVSVLVTLGMLGGVLFTFAQKNKLNHEVASINRQISEAQSESTRLNSQLDALVSVEMIDQYAVEKLGMSKNAIRSNALCGCGRLYAGSRQGAKDPADPRRLCPCGAGIRKEA